MPSYKLEVIFALRTTVAIHDHHDCVALIEGGMEQFMHVKMKECWVGFDKLLRMFALKEREHVIVEDEGVCFYFEDGWE
jgi:hypothetical protein